jgi:phage terminase Nu1 subunit (DNA packaging protein)
MSNDYLITQVEFARLMGVSKQAVSKAVKEGRIKLILDYTDGKLKLNPDLAAKQWRENSMPRVENSKITNPFKESRESKEEAASIPGSKPSHIMDDADLLEAKTEKERFQAKLLELEFKEKTGELISAEKAKREAFKLGRLIRDAILNVPSQICNELAAETDPFKVHQKLSYSLTKAMEVMVQEAQKLGPQETSQEEEPADE